MVFIGSWLFCTLLRIGGEFQQGQSLLLRIGGDVAHVAGGAVVT